MKIKFSTHWKESKQPRKKRKYLFNAPQHIKRKFMSATLEKKLREKHNRRSLEVKKGDEVKVMRGKFAGKTGKIIEVKVKASKIAVEGMQMQKRDGSKVNVWIHPSNVMLISLNTDDKKRIVDKTVKETKVEVKTTNEQKLTKVNSKSEVKK